LPDWSTAIFTATIAVGKKIWGSAWCPQCMPGLTVVTTVDLVNQTITIQSNPEIGIFVPMHEFPLLDLDPMLNPFSVPP